MRTRDTTRPEDRSYCILGILGVSLPIICGEDGKNTSSRLKQALIDKYRNNELAGLQQILDSGSGNEQTNPVSPMLGRALPQTRRKAVLDSLAFKQMDSRLATIKSEHASTCSLMLEHSVYRAWTDPDKLPQHHGFLWLAGKPGSGKSTMMKCMRSLPKGNARPTLSFPSSPTREAEKWRRRLSGFTVHCYFNS